MSEQTVAGSEVIKTINNPDQSGMGRIGMNQLDEAIQEIGVLIRQPKFLLH